MLACVTGDAAGNGDGWGENLGIQQFQSPSPPPPLPTSLFSPFLLTSTLTCNRNLSPSFSLPSLSPSPLTLALTLPQVAGALISMLSARELSRPCALVASRLLSHLAPALGRLDHCSDSGACTNMSPDYAFWLTPLSLPAAHTDYVHHCR